MFDKLAEELQQARIKNNLSLKDLSARTRIDLKFLEALEEGNFSFLPELYVKAFLKEYANAAGLNPDIILKKYERAREGLPYEYEPEDQPARPETQEEVKAEEKISAKPEEKTPEKTEDKKEKFREIKHSAHQSNAIYSKPAAFDSTAPKRSETMPGNKNSIIIGASIGGAIILIGLIYMFFFSSNDQIVVPEKPYDEVVTESQRRYEETPGSTVDSTQSKAVSTDSLNLLIHTTDTSWVKLILDNTKEEEFILFPNSQKSLKAADNFKITFGKSSAIKLQLNNKPLVFNPKSKSVSHVKIDSNGIEYLQDLPQAGKK